MSAQMIQTIMQVRELRKAVRTPTLTPEARAAIDHVHQIVKLQSSEGPKVHWRTGGGGSSSYHPPPRNGGGRHYNHGGNGHGNGQGQGYGGNNRHYNGHGHGHSSGNNNNGPRFHPKKEAPPSIPLANSSDAPEEAPFETVRHHGNNRRNNHYHGGAQRHHHHGSSHHQEHPSGPPVKYVSRFRKQSANAEDIIMTKILGKLNKFSSSNYNEIKEFITHIIDSGQTEMIKCFMQLVFQKAASEEMFCPLYARLLSELSARYPILLEDMNRLYSEYMAIFDDVSDGTDETYLEMCDRNVEKKYRRGYSQFLAELIKHQILDTNVFLQIVMKIVQQVEVHVTKKESIKLMEELADCLLKIVRAIQATGNSQSEEKEESDEEEAATAAASSDSTSTVMNSIGKLSDIRSLMSTDEMLARVQSLTVRDVAKEGLSNKARFTFMDCYDGMQTFSS